MKNPDKGSSSESQEQEPIITIKRSADAPLEIKKNPFYDPEFWGRADSPEDIYLPDSDEALSFALAAHEIGHLIREGRRTDTSLDNFEATRAEEQRAWNGGWKYLQKYLGEYYEDSSEDILEVQQSFKRIRDLATQVVDLSEGMYLKRGTLDNIDQREKDRILKEQRETFFSSRSKETKIILQKIKKEKNGVKPDWERFKTIVGKAVKDIIDDNERG